MENKNFQQQNDEIEIDLRELWQELKKNFSLIAGVTATFVVAAAVYSFVIAKPVYEYNAMIRIPNGVSGAQINNFVEIFKDDIKPDAELKDPNSKLVTATLLKGTSVIKLTFEGESQAKARSFGEAYTKKAIEKINDVIMVQEKQKFSREVVSMIRSDVNYISSRLRESNFNTEDASNKLNYLLERIETKEKNKMFIPAEFAKEANNPEKPIRPKKAKNIALAFVAGMFLSCGIVVTRYIFNKEA